MSDARRSILSEAGLPPAPQAFVNTIPPSAPVQPESEKRRGRKALHKRNRNWETRNRPQTFTGVPESIRNSLVGISQEYRAKFGMQGGVDAVARELLRYALSEYHAGRLVMDRPGAQAASVLSSGAGWGLAPRKILARKKVEKNFKRVSVTYRLPDDLNKAIRAIPLLEQEKAAPLVIHLPLGHVVTRLLAYALEAYEADRLVLFTIPQETISGLAGKVQK